MNDVNYMTGTEEEREKEQFKYSIEDWGTDIAIGNKELIPFGWYKAIKNHTGTKVEICPCAHCHGNHLYNKHVAVLYTLVTLFYSLFDLRIFLEGDSKNITIQEDTAIFGITGLEDSEVTLGFDTLVDMGVISKDSAKYKHCISEETDDAGYGLRYMELHMDINFEKLREMAGVK